MYKTVPITDTQFDTNSGYRELSFHLKDDHVKVNLEPSSGVLVHKNTPVYTAKSVNDIVKLTRKENASIFVIKNKIDF